jgi:hypothetical protein
MSREQELEQTINQLLTQQEQQIGAIQTEGAGRGIVRPFATGLEGALRRQTAAEVAPFQRELTARREEEERQFQRNIQQQRLNIDRARLALAQQQAARTGSLSGASQALEGSNNQTKLQFFLENADIPAGVQTNIGDVLSVIEGITGLAEESPEGQFAGIGPGSGIALPRFRGEEGTQNRQKLSAIKLMAERWASGASLTEKQTKEVNKLIPRPGNTDKVVRNKINGLVDFMLDDVNGNLKASGVFGFEPAKSDFFGTQAPQVDVNALLEAASPEELAELRALGLID